jgi:hypothetical protein
LNHWQTNTPSEQGFAAHIEALRSAALAGYRRGAGPRRATVVDYFGMGLGLIVWSVVAVSLRPRASRTSSEARSPADTLTRVKIRYEPDIASLESSVDDEPGVTDQEGARGPEPFEVGPAAPTHEVRAELRALLAADDTRLGQVYNCLEQGLGASAIAEQLGVATIGFVWNQTRTIKVLLDNDLPTAPTVAFTAARTFRSLLRRKSVSARARSYLENTLDELERRANDVRGGASLRSAARNARRSVTNSD